MPVSNRNRLLSFPKNGTATLPTSPPLQRGSVLIYHTRFQELERVANLKPGSAQLILTDPPYNRDWLPQWTDLAALAARLLADGGLLATYSGKYYLPTVMAALGRRLTYRWTSASVWDVQGSPTDSLQVRGSWSTCLP
jgi:site-specific DNA-methyltransferase (adenine-specific)